MAESPATPTGEKLVQYVPDHVLTSIQHNFHQVVLGRLANTSVDVEGLAMPALRDVPVSESDAAWFPVPGMYGGFKYWLDTSGDQAMLICESWCRVVEGSGQRHEITAEGAILVDEGFV